MQIRCLHKNLYILYSLVIPEKIKTDYEKLCEEQVKQWELFQAHGISNKKKQELIGISRATYYRKKNWLKLRIYKSKRPKHVRQSRFGPDRLMGAQSSWMNLRKLVKNLIFLSSSYFLQNQHTMERLRGVTGSLERSFMRISLRLLLSHFCLNLYIR